MDEHEKLVKALREVFSDNNNQDRPILINRIPFICNDIKDIKTALEERVKAQNQILTDLAWMKWIGSGFVGAAGLLALKSLGI